MTKEERNQVILLMVFRLKYFGSCHDVAIDLIKHGAEPQLIAILETVAKRFNSNNPNFIPIPF